MLKGKCCLVTGGAQGIGRAMAEALLKEGAKVFLADINAEKLHETQVKLAGIYGKESVWSRKCDVTKDLEETFKDAHISLGHIDIVANNAGVVDEYSIDLCVNVNMLAVMKGTNLAIEYMSPEKGGSGGVIINTSSVAGLDGVPFLPTYSATKTGIISFTSAYAKNAKVVANNIRLNCICPGATDTDIQNDVFEKSLCEPAWLRQLLKNQELCTTEYIAGGFMELVTNTKITGATMKITKEEGYQLRCLKEAPFGHCE